MDNEETASLGARLRNGSLYQRAPAHLRAQIMAGVRNEQKKRHSMRLRLPAWAAPWQFVGGALTGSAVCALAFGVFLWVQQAARVDPIAQEIVASHVRALLSTREIDVVSSDQHTVKPWFNGRIDYVPPVVKPSAEGFALVGGRLDYVGHRPVSVLVYRYLKHPIDVYVFPDGSRAQAAQSGEAPAAAITQSEDGYAIANWHQNGMAYWAVSDASTSVMRMFAKEIQKDEGK
jgi:anti-sigma factor RsiW